MINSCHSSFQQLSPTMTPTLTTASVELMVSLQSFTSRQISPSSNWCFQFLSADLIMLGLATHEPNFTIIREEFKPNKPRPCALCGQMGHELKECQGAAREKKGQVGSPPCVIDGGFSGVLTCFFFSFSMMSLQIRCRRQSRSLFSSDCLFSERSVIFITSTKNKNFNIHGEDNKQLKWTEHWRALNCSTLNSSAELFKTLDNRPKISLFDL